jgi:dTMP kinase
MPCVLTCEPGGTRFGKELRKVLLRHDGIKREPIAELMLYLADRYQHLKEVVEPNLERGLHVISDRYHDATLAYQAYARGIGFEITDRLAEILEIRRPDATFVLDLDVELGLRRARQRNQEQADEKWGRFEAETIDFHRRVREGYKLIGEGDPDRVHIVDASGQPEEVRSRLVSKLVQLGIFSPLAAQD